MLLILGSVGGLLVAADQLTKLAVRQSFALGESVPVWGDFFRLTYIHNVAGAFGVWFGHPAVYYIASIIISLIIIHTICRRPDLRSWSTWGLTLVLGGAIGNLIDRVFVGEVVDFLDFEFFDLDLPSFKFLFIHFRGYTMTRWPIFNLADSSIFCGIWVLILSVWLDPPDKSLSTIEGTMPQPIPGPQLNGAGKPDDAVPM